MAKSNETVETTKEEPKKIEYVATKECMYQNKWFGEGKTIMADENFKHACFVKRSDYVERKKAGKIYDPTREEIEKVRLGEVMRGVYKN